MIVAIFGAALWLAMGVDEPAEIQAGLVLMALSYLLAGVVPIWLRHRHVVAQNRLLDRCRALLMAGTRAAAQGDRAEANHFLGRIRRLEGLWRLGDSWAYRLSLAFSAIGTAMVLCVLARYFGLLLRHHIWMGRPLPADEIVAHLKLAAIISVAAPLDALIAYGQAWRQPWAIDKCGDRLWQLLHGPRALAASSRSGEDEPDMDLDGLSPREIFGWVQPSSGMTLTAHGAGWFGFSIRTGSGQGPGRRPLRRSMPPMTASGLKLGDVPAGRTPSREPRPARPSSTQLAHQSKTRSLYQPPAEPEWSAI